MSIALLSYLGSDGAMQTAFAAGDARLVAKYLSKELGFELEVEFAEEQLRAQLPKGSPEEQQRVRVFLAERFCLRDDRSGGASSDDANCIGKFPFIIDFFNAVQFRNRQAAAVYLEDLLWYCLMELP